MPSPALTEAVHTWRVAERRWESTDPADVAFQGGSVDLISAWLMYQFASDGFEPGSVVLVADDEQRYVAVRGDVKAMLGYEPAELLGRRIEDITAPDLALSTPADWLRFVADGRQDGEYRIVASDGREVPVRFRARAHHPIPGYHLSRIRRADEPADGEPEATDAAGEAPAGAGAMG